MKATWRWFGPRDLAKIDDMMQAGVEGVVSALHHIPNGAVWTTDEIAKREAEIARRSDGSPSGLAWDVVESLPVSEDIKKQKGDWRTHIANYKTSLENLAAAGIEIICYNFMPVLDWTRTDLAWRVASGATCMRFDIVDFAVFDIHLLERPGAATDFAADTVAEAKIRFAAMTERRKTEIVQNITAGLPGATEVLTLSGVREHLAQYDHISADRLRANFIAFLEEVVPVAERLGMRLCCHPDDPPFPLLGLPRVMSTEADYQAVLSAVDSPANGATLCAGSLGARPDNDLVGMMERLGPKVHFLHLRNVKRDSSAIAGSFYEDEHLAGDTDMVALIAAVVREEARRRAEGRADHQIPMRPDHGQDILDDLGRKAQPGYPTIGRLKGLAELRGVMRAFEHPALGLAATARESEIA
ncbi:mannonate dehydratase [Pelagibacterium halotolerans]|uniref:Mannonate dehydratase n=1 Tax=Pelagibacterium halotolerans (strain DSM 22347 / JCM 15775 / CGMCC 1.7692 / B2) TaxID=1082931 RepID=G4RBE3_PELHB|nr:mannonate dehydratase [Pelagibacterium halotolerans]AEQ52619.1 mannonate dehydratase [Pelagibacterium halotolerans B2]QJR17672.1 mannonate dehydratase [Pelagibacterium halotolerans]SEA83316.1 D-mannonate dehydratase [Pelagibacterium halotolerans]